MSGKTKFEKLLEPFHIGQVRTRNRIIKTAAGMSFVGEYGFIGERRNAFYEVIAKGGAGLIIVEPCPVEYPLGSYLPDLIRIDDDKFLPGLTELTRVMHKHGCPTFLQLVHAGPWHQTPNDSPAWVPPWPSRLQRISSSYMAENEFPGPDFDVPREVTTTDIEDVVDKFARAAERAREAGFDGVEINADTANLVNSFLSRVYNRRQDDYGCRSLGSRARFLVEIIRETKKRVGPDFAVTILFNGAEYGVDKGTTIEEARGFARIMQDAGADALQVRAHGYGDYFQMIFPEYLFCPALPEVLPKELDWSRHGAGVTVPLAAAVKQVVTIPVIGVGRLSPEFGEQLLHQGKVDFVGMSRRLMADPELPNKLAAGSLEDIAPCTACLGCISEIITDKPVRCRVNGALGGKEEYYYVTPSEKKKRVVVIGGGPAGMEAARVAAIRGHEVILYEKEHKLGGLLPLAAMVKGVEIEDLVALVRYLKTQIIKLGVKIRLREEFHASLVEEIKPDAVILAAGGVPGVLEIPGANRRNVVSGSDLHLQLKTYMKFLGPQVLRWLTRFWMPLGKNVVIIGGEIQGCELAEFLLKRGRKVTIVHIGETLGDGLPEANKFHYVEWLTKKGVVITGVKYEEINEKGLVITTREGERQTINADTIVIALPFKPNTELIKALEGKAPEVYSIGDCSEPRLIMDAIGDGYRIARDI